MAHEKLNSIHTNKNKIKLITLFLIQNNERIQRQQNPGTYKSIRINQGFSI